VRGQLILNARLTSPTDASRKASHWRQYYVSHARHSRAPTERGSKERIGLRGIRLELDSIVEPYGQRLCLTA
jgi:hypothetical protein